MAGYAFFLAEFWLGLGSSSLWLLLGIEVLNWLVITLPSSHYRLLNNMMPETLWVHLASHGSVQPLACMCTLLPGCQVLCSKAPQQEMMPTLYKNIAVNIFLPF